MKRPLILSAVATLIATSAAHAAPIGAFSELQMSHSFVVNGGDVPAGVEISNLSSSYQIDVDATSMVDDPAAATSETNFVQIGNPFSAPPLPFVLDRNNATQLPGGFEGAAAGVEIEVTTEDDPDDDEFDITRRSIDQEGSASAILLDDTIAASATSFVRSGRNYLFSNTTNQLLSFNVAGQFEALLRAEYTGTDGLARVAGGFELEFVGINGVEITYFPISPYLTTTQNSDPGAFVSQSFDVSTGGSAGLTFTAAASATGNGGTTLASFEADHRYILGLTLDPFAQVLLRTSYTQVNAVEHLPLDTMVPVPLPAGGVLLLSGLFGFAAIRRRRMRLPRSA